MKRSTRTLFLLLATAVGLPAAIAQPGGPGAAAPEAAAPGASSGQLPSALFAPAIGQVREALAITQPAKWKMPAPVTQETNANIASIQHDLDNTLPGLLATADSNPASVAEVLPAYRNVEALYEVLLRVTQMSTIVATPKESVALQQALLALEKDRRTLGDQLQTSATNQTKAIVALQSNVRDEQTQVAAAKAAVPACPEVPAPAKRRTTATTKPKAATTPKSSTTTPSTTPAKPQ